jgi:hypothetical protein
MRPLLLTVAAALALTPAGCGPGTTDITGRVTFQGKPVVYGTVVVIDADGVPKSGLIARDATFRVTGIRVGAAKAAVSSPPPPGAIPLSARDKKVQDDDNNEKVTTPPPSVDPELVRSWFPLPEKYGDPAKSEITLDVRSGRPPYELELK